MCQVLVPVYPCEKALTAGDRGQNETVSRLRAAITMADVMKFAWSGGGNDDRMPPDLVAKFLVGTRRYCPRPRQVIIIVV
jgi:hypothetical protein